MNEQITQFLQESIRLKRILRSGWIFSGVALSDVESVADHSYMVTLLTLIAALDEKQKDETLDLEKVLIMALLHDLSECLTHDLDKRIRNYSPKKYDAFKKELDKNALEVLLKALPKSEYELLKKSFKEYEKGESKEAKLVKDADRLETIFQLIEYCKEGYSKNFFSEFIDNFSQDRKKFHFQIIHDLAEKLLEQIK